MVNCAKWTRHGDGWMMKGMMMIVVMMIAIHHTSADLSSLIQLTARSVRERPERAALEPPTVTSLRPSDRNKGGRSTGGVVVQSEQSGSHIPPVVASRSPSSSSNHKDYNTRYIHMNSRFNQPSAPVATASSGSRSRNPGGMTGRRSLSNDHQTVPAPTPHLFDGTSVSSPRESSWGPPVSFAPPPPPRGSYGSSGYAPVARSYPRHHRVREDSVVPQPSYVNGMPRENNPPIGGGGVWGEERRQSSHPRGHHRSYSHSITEDTVRTDTFGHIISEDLSHLNTEYSPRRGGSRRSQALPPRRNGDAFHPSRGINHPREDSIHIMNHTNQTDNFRGQKTSSHPSRDRNTEPFKKFGLAPTLHQFNFHTDRTHLSPAHPRESDTQGEFTRNYDHNTHAFQQNGTSIHHSSISELHPNTSVSDGNNRRPLTVYEIFQLKNLSNWEEFTEFLQKRGLTVGEVLSYINDGATKQELLNIFDEAESTKAASVQTEEMDGVRGRKNNRNTPGGKKKNKRKGKNKKKGRKNRERNKRKRGRKDKKQTNPDFIYTTVILPVDISRNESMNQLIPPEPTVTMSPSSSTISSTVLNDTSSGQITHEEPSSSTVPFDSTKPTFTDHSPEPPLLNETSIQSESPILIFPDEQTPTELTQNFTSHKPVTVVETTTSLQPTLSQSTVSTQHALTSWPHSATLPPTTPVSLTTATTMKPILLPTTTTQEIPTPSGDMILPTMIPSDFSKPTQTTPLPRSEGPKAGSLTLPPTSKTSEVSIISFTFREVPKHETREETALEDVTPIRKTQNHRKSHKKTHKSHPKRIYSPPKLLPSMTTKKMDDGMVIRTPFVREESRDDYTFPVKGFMIITGIMGALAVFTLVVLISYAIIKCSKQPVVNNYQVSEQKPATQ